MNNITIKDLINNVAKYDVTALEMIKKAYDYADYLHEGQMRESGDKYITHPLNVAYILSNLSVIIIIFVDTLRFDCYNVIGIFKQNVPK